MQENTLLRKESQQTQIFILASVSCPEMKKSDLLMPDQRSIMHKKCILKPNLIKTRCGQREEEKESKTEHAEKRVERTTKA